MRKLFASLVAGAIGLTAVAVPAAAQGSGDPGIVDVVIDVSGPTGFDTNIRDYDLLRDALLATELADDVAAATDITVFAPRDQAFIRLARDLGYRSHDEAGAFAFLAEATGFNSAADPGLLDDVLLYHVVPGAATFAEASGAGPLATLLTGASVEVVGNRVVDGDPNDADARIKKPANLVTSNGIIHTVNRVLRPTDLDAPTDGIVDIVIDASGATGFDTNPRDYDLLRDALLAAELADDVAAATDITVFAPRDQAFIRLARDLGYTGVDEAGAFAFLVTATGFNSAADPGLLDDVLLYHVVPGAATFAEASGAGPLATLLTGASVEVVGNRVVDGDPDDADARIKKPSNIEATNGIIHTVNRVLRPTDL